ncbi:MAG TPA: hypothetical protein VIU11_23650 [Nakamurella sp.]
MTHDPGPNLSDSDPAIRKVPGPAARTLAALLTLRDRVIAPIIAGVRRPRPGRPPITHTRVDRDYATLRKEMGTHFHDLAIDAAA